MHILRENLQVHLESPHAVNDVGVTSFELNSLLL